MTDLALAGIVLALTGIYAVRWTLRLAPAWSELPLKTLTATALAGLVAIAEMAGVALPAATRVPALALAAVYVMGPLAITALGRGGAYTLAWYAITGLYWTTPARDGVRRLLAQVALRRGDVDAADRLIPEGAALLRMQAWALAERWDDVLAMPEIEAERGNGAAAGDNLALAEDARIEALLAIGRLDEAARRVALLEAAAASGEVGPVTVRISHLAGARLSAARGRVEETQRRLREVPSGAPAHVAFAILATAAMHAGHPAQAELWRQAYAVAPPALRDRYATRVLHLGESLPQVRVRRPIGTYALAVSVGAAFLAQLALDRWIGSVPTAVGVLDASSLVAAFTLNVPGVPASDAWWRYLSYAFVHGGVLHAGFNLWVLLDLGRLYEGRREWGDLVGAFTLGTAMGAYLTQIAQAGDVLVLVGASGGVLGVGGALLADVARGRSGSDRMLMRSLLQWMALITLFSFAVPGVSLWGHVGGVVGGLLYGFARQGSSAVPHLSRAVGLVAVALLAVTVGSILATCFSVF